MIPKQDRAQVRTPAQLEQKYNFDKSLKEPNIFMQKLEKTLQNLSQLMNQNIININAKIDSLSNDLIQSWIGNGVPTLKNQPAMEWVEDKSEVKHIGDIYYNNDDGTIYIFKCTNEIYEWAKCYSAVERYHITFYDVEGIVVAGYVIKKGDAIKSPIVDAVWVNSEGVEVSFPYIPTDDINLYLLNGESTL